MEFQVVQGLAEPFIDMQEHSCDFRGIRRIQGIKGKNRGIQKNIGEYKIIKETKGWKMELSK